MSTTHVAYLVLGVHSTELPAAVVEDIRDGCYGKYGVFGYDNDICGYEIERTEWCTDVTALLNIDHSKIIEDFEHMFQVTPSVHLVLGLY